MNSKKVIPFLLAALGIVACEKNRELDFEPGDGRIAFGLATGYENDSKTRTEYSGEDENGHTMISTSQYERIDWVAAHDRIQILCKQTLGSSGAANNSGVYQISGTPTTDGRKSEAEADAVTGTTPFYWGTGMHYFYALYPAAGTTSNYHNDEVTAGRSSITSTSDTKAQIAGTIPAAQSLVKSGNIYKPNMNYAYMYAATKTEKTDNRSVSLAFKPLVTAFEFSLKALDDQMTETDLVSLTLASASTPLAGSFTAALDLDATNVVDLVPDEAATGSITVSFPENTRLSKTSYAVATVLALGVDQTDLTLTLTFAGGMTRSIALYKSVNNVPTPISVAAGKKTYIKLGVPYPDPLTIEAIEDGSVFVFNMAANPIQYSLDNGETWTDISSKKDVFFADGTEVEGLSSVTTDEEYLETLRQFCYDAGYYYEIPVHAGDVVLLKGNNTTYAPWNDHNPFYYDAAHYTTYTLPFDKWYYSAREHFLPSDPGIAAAQNWQYYTALARFMYRDMGDFGSGSRIWTTGPSYVYGNMMSLIGGAEYATLSAFTDDCVFWDLFRGPMFTGSEEHPFENPIQNHPARQLLLPATTLTFQCYKGLFSNCTSLAVAPELPAVTGELPPYCYQSMFSGCTSLTTAPVLGATAFEMGSYDIGGGQYETMFEGCTSLTSAPVLPATTVSAYCYSGMFSGCTSLTTAPALPATTLSEYCYAEMFSGCTSLTVAPELPAEDEALPFSCYSYMFAGCTSLTTAPDLPATALFRYPIMNKSGDHYSHMFEGCTSLISAPALPATELGYSCYESMFKGCTSLTAAPTLAATTLFDSCYKSMFEGCTSLISAPDLPATTIAQYCYYSMFEGCSSLTSAPALPATTLAPLCYYSMFKGCSSLTSAPALPATHIPYGSTSYLGNDIYGYAYDHLFEGCSSLSSIECMATTFDDFNYYDSENNQVTGPWNGFQSWTEGVAATGTFTKAAGVTWPTGNDGIPAGWTVQEN